MNATQAAFVCIALVVCASADVENDMANERGEIEYRLSFKTKDVEPAGKDFTDAETAQRKQFTSTGKFNVEIIGVDGTTGEHEMIDHPSMVKSDDGSWKTEPGMVQVARMKAANVGEIKEVKITGDNEDKWEPSWIKVNSNDFHSGEGNGIYYSRITKPVSKNQAVSASLMLILKMTTICTSALLSSARSQRRGCWQREMTSPQPMNMVDTLGLLVRVCQELRGTTQ